MLFKLVPTSVSKLATPPELYIHSLPVPKGLSKPARVPPAYVRTKKAIVGVGLNWPGNIAADLATWLSVVVREVKWDFTRSGGPVVVIRCADGTFQEWTLQGVDDVTEEKLSEEYVDTTEEDEPAETQSSSRSSFPRTTPSPKFRAARSKIGSMYDRLDELAFETSVAWEGLIAPSDGSPSLINLDNPAEDYQSLLTLSADPSVELPYRWQGPVESISGGGALLQLDQDAEGVADIEMMNLGGPTSPHDGEKFADAIDTEPSSGQLQKRSRSLAIRISSVILRPSTSTESLLSARASPSVEPESITSVNSLHLTAFLALLTETRHLLIDLYALTVIPKLRELFPPTYSLWATESAFEWTHRQARILGEGLAKQILGLLDDDGSSCETSDEDGDEDTEDEDELASSGDEIDDEVDNGYERRYSSAARRRSEREQRKERNILSAMKDDYELRMWCERALVTARTLSDVNIATRAWFNEFTPWRVERPYPVATSDSPTTIRITQSGTKTKISQSKNKKVAFDVTSGSESSSSVSFSPIFTIEDPMGMQLLPPRLPRTVLKSSPFPPLPKSMQYLQRELRESLNMLSGMQKKMVELHTFIEEARESWNLAKEVERHETSTDKPTRPPSKNSLSATGFVPYAQQPLRFVTADKTISTRLSGAVEQLHSAGKTLGKKKEPVTASEISSTSSGPTPPRRRKKSFNMTLIERVESNVVRNVVPAPSTSTSSSTSTSPSKSDTATPTPTSITTNLAAEKKIRKKRPRDESKRVVIVLPSKKRKGASKDVSESSSSTGVGAVESKKKRKKKLSAEASFMATDHSHAQSPLYQSSIGTSTSKSPPSSPASSLPSSPTPASRSSGLLQPIKFSSSPPRSLFFPSIARPPLHLSQSNRKSVSIDLPALTLPTDPLAMQRTHPVDIEQLHSFSATSSSWPTHTSLNTDKVKEEDGEEQIAMIGRNWQDNYSIIEGEEEENGSFEFDDDGDLIVPRYGEEAGYSTESDMSEEEDLGVNAPEDGEVMENEGEQLEFHDRIRLSPGSTPMYYDHHNDTSISLQPHRSTSSFPKSFYHHHNPIQLISHDDDFPTSSTRDTRSYNESTLNSDRLLSAVTTLAPFHHGSSSILAPEPVRYPPVSLLSRWIDGEEQIVEEEEEDEGRTGDIIVRAPPPALRTTAPFLFDPPTWITALSLDPVAILPAAVPAPILLSQLLLSPASTTTTVPRIEVIGEEDESNEADQSMAVEDHGADDSGQFEDSMKEEMELG